MLQNFPDVQDSYETLNEDRSLLHLFGREREMWLPLLALAYHIDSDRAIAETNGDTDAAIQLFQSRHGAWRADPTSDDLVFGRMVALQKIKEGDRRSSESDQSIEIGVLKSIRELIADGNIGAASGGSLDGQFYAVNDMAALVSKDLQESGALHKDRPISGRRLAAILYKTSAALQADQRETKSWDPESNKRKTVRCLPLTPARLEATILRLGGRL